MRKDDAVLIFPPNRWKDAPVLETMRRLNERCFALLAHAAYIEDFARAYKSVYSDPELWAKVDSRAQTRAARCPVLLMDLNFQRADWWLRVENISLDTTHRDGPPKPLLAAQIAPLLRDIVMEAWRTARSIPRATSLVFGMAPTVTTAIARLAAADIDRIVAAHSLSIRPRWEQRAEFWRQLLQAAMGTDDEALANVQLHCLQLLGSELAPPGGF